MMREAKSVGPSNRPQSFTQTLESLQNQEAARVYLESHRWPAGSTCPWCGLCERVTVRKGGFYRCNKCKEDFTVRTGLVLERSHVPLHKWVKAMHLLATTCERVSSSRLSKEISVTQKSALFVLRRLHEACGADVGESLRTEQEAIEAMVGRVMAYRRRDEAKQQRIA